MQVLQLQWKAKTGWLPIGQNTPINNADLILCIGERNALEKNNGFDEFRPEHPNARMVYSSTAGKIYDIDVNDDSISAILMQFDDTPINEFLNDFLAITNI